MKKILLCSPINEISVSDCNVYNGILVKIFDQVIGFVRVSQGVRYFVQPISSATIIQDFAGLSLQELIKFYADYDFYQL